MSDWKTLAIEKCEQYAFELRHEDELWEVFSDYCNPCGHIEMQQTEIKKLQSQLALAREGLEFYNIGFNAYNKYGMNQLIFLQEQHKKAREILAQLDKKDGE